MLWLMVLTVSWFLTYPGDSMKQEDHVHVLDVDVTPSTEITEMEENSARLSAKLEEYNRLMCNIMFSTQMHMYVVKGILFDKQMVKQRALTKWLLEKILCDTTVLRMLQLMLNVEGMRVNELLLIYMYKDQIIVHASNIPKNPKVSQKLLDLHELVSSVLEKYTSVNCAEGDAFKIETEKLDVFTENYKNAIDRNDKTHDVEIMYALIDNQRNLVDLMNDMYLKIDTIPKDRKFKDTKLYLSHAIKQSEIMNDLIKTLAGLKRFDNVVYKICSSIQKARLLPGIECITSLGQYQRMFVDLLKIIALRLTSKHLSYIQTMDDANEMTNEDYIQYKVKYQMLLKEFVDFVYLYKDPFMIKVLHYFNSEIPYFMRNMDTSIEEIKSHLNSVAEMLGCTATDPLYMDDVTSSKSFDAIKEFMMNFLYMPYFKEKTRQKPIDDTYLAMEVFLSYLEILFDSIVFQVAHSLDKMIEEL